MTYTNNAAADMNSSNQELLYPSQVSEFFRNRSYPTEIGKRFGRQMVFGKLIMTPPAQINAFILCNPQFIDEDMILIEKIDAA